MLTDTSIKCDGCGRFISYADLDAGKAKHEFKQDWRGEENYDSLCPACWEKEKQREAA